MSLETLKTKVGLLIEKAQSGGGGEVITITTACVNTLEAYNIFKEFIEENEKNIMFKKIPENNEFVVENEGIFFIINNTINFESGKSCLYSRYRSGVFNFYNITAPAYDFIINVGDTFEKVVLF